MKKLLLAAALAAVALSTPAYPANYVCSGPTACPKQTWFTPIALFYRCTVSAWFGIINPDCPAQN